MSRDYCEWKSVKIILLNSKIYIEYRAERKAGEVAKSTSRVPEEVEIIRTEHVSGLDVFSRAYVCGVPKCFFFFFLSY